MPVGHGGKIKESEKMDKYFDLVRELKKFWNMRVTVMPIVIGAQRTVPKAWKKNKEN